LTGAGLTEIVRNPPKWAYKRAKNGIGEKEAYYLVNKESDEQNPK
jgi:hypothetical protein